VSFEFALFSEIVPYLTVTYCNTASVI